MPEKFLAREARLSPLQIAYTFDMVFQEHYDLSFVLGLGRTPQHKTARICLHVLFGELIQVARAEIQVMPENVKPQEKPQPRRRETKNAGYKRPSWLDSR